MNAFVQRHHGFVIGVLNGFDRVRFRGTLRWLCYADGLGKYLSCMKLLLKDFSDYTQGITGRIRQAAGRGEYLLNGFRNRGLRQRLFAPSDDPATRRRQSAAVTCKLRLLRAHGLIRKVPRTHRYLLTEKGRQGITALLAAQAADTAKLTRAA